MTIEILEFDKFLEIFSREQRELSNRHIHSAR